jgi:hypothetical protein
VPAYDNFEFVSWTTLAPNGEPAQNRPDPTFVSAQIVKDPQRSIRDTDKRASTLTEQLWK